MEKRPPDLDNPVVIGVISAAHGVRGTIKVKAPGSGRHLRKGAEPVLNGERRRILASRQTPKGFLIDLEGIDDRVLAASLRGSELLLDLCASKPFEVIFLAYRVTAAILDGDECSL